jgi:uncharacterized protein (TIGR02118 family)
MAKTIAMIQMIQSSSKYLRNNTMIKLVVMIKRKPGMSKEDFDRYWSGPHADQVLGCADFKRHIRRYVQSHVVAQEGIKLPWAVSEYDGQAELCFDSVDEMNAAFNEQADWQRGYTE